MNDYIYLYIMFSISVGLLYTFNWTTSNKEVFHNFGLRSQKIMVVIIVFVISTSLAPFSLYDLTKSVVKRGGKQ